MHTARVARWLAVACASCAWSAPAATLLQDVRVIDGSGHASFEHADLLFRN